MDEYIVAIIHNCTLFCIYFTFENMKGKKEEEAIHPCGDIAFRVRPLDIEIIRLMPTGVFYEVIEGTQSGM